MGYNTETNDRFMAWHGECALGIFVFRYPSPGILTWDTNLKYDERVLTWYGINFEMDEESQAVIQS